MSSARDDGGQGGATGGMPGQEELQALMQRWWQSFSASNAGGPMGSMAGGMPGGMPGASGPGFGAGLGGLGAGPGAGFAGGGFGAGPGSATGAGDPTQAWQQMVQQWSRMVGEQGGADAAAAGARFDQQAAGWYGTMQEVAGRFAGRDTTSAEVANAWRDALQGQGEQAFRSMLDAARGSTQWGNDPWLRDMTSLLETIQRESGPWMKAPVFGPGRVHQARWQQLAKLQQDYQAHSQAYADQIRAALDDAFTLFEQRLGEHEAPGSQLTSARALFDLWIDVAEEAYGKVAMSASFQQVYADFANAQMRLRAAIQDEVEQVGQSVGLPTRSEMDSAHRRIVELERQMRRVMQRLERVEGGGAGAVGSPASHRPRVEAAAPARKAPATAAAAATAVSEPAGKAKAGTAQKRAATAQGASKPSESKQAAPAVKKTTSSAAPKTQGKAPSKVPTKAATKAAGTTSTKASTKPSTRATSAKPAATRRGGGA